MLSLPQRYRRVFLDLFRQDGNLHQGDPGIMLFELQLILIRLAWDTYPKEM